MRNRKAPPVSQENPRRLVIAAPLAPVMAATSRETLPYDPAWDMFEL